MSDLLYKKTQQSAFRRNPPPSTASTTSWKSPKPLAKPKTNKYLVLKNPKTRKITPTSECILCRKKIAMWQMAGIINRALYRRYCSSLNYYYTRDINKILANSSCLALLIFKEKFIFDIKHEWLKRLYRESEFLGKMSMVLRYQEYRVFRPRIHIQSMERTLDKYYMGHSRLKEKELKKQIEREEMGKRQRGLKGQSYSSKNLKINMEKMKRIEDRSQVLESLDPKGVENRMLGALDNDISYQKLVADQASQANKLKMVNANLKMAIGRNLEHASNNAFENQDQSYSRIINLNGRKNSISTTSQQQLKEKVSEIFSMDMSRRISCQILFDPEIELSRSFLDFAPTLIFGEETTREESGNQTTENKKKKEDEKRRTHQKSESLFSHVGLKEEKGLQRTKETQKSTEVVFQKIEMTQEKAKRNQRTPSQTTKTNPQSASSSNLNSKQISNEESASFQRKYESQKEPSAHAYPRTTIEPQDKQQKAFGDFRDDFNSRPHHEKHLSLNLKHNNFIKEPSEENHQRESEISRKSDPNEKRNSTMKEKKGVRCDQVPKGSGNKGASGSSQSNFTITKRFSPTPKHKGLRDKIKGAADHSDETFSNKAKVAKEQMKSEPPTLVPGGMVKSQSTSQLTSNLVKTQQMIQLKRANEKSGEVLEKMFLNGNQERKSSFRDHRSPTEVISSLKKTSLREVRAKKVEIGSNAHFQTFASSNSHGNGSSYGPSILGRYESNPALVTTETLRRAEEILGPLKMSNSPTARFVNGTEVYPSREIVEIQRQINLRRSIENLCEPVSTSKFRSIYGTLPASNNAKMANGPALASKAQSRNTQGFHRHTNTQVSPQFYQHHQPASFGKDSGFSQPKEVFQAPMMNPSQSQKDLTKRTVGDNFKKKAILSIESRSRSTPKK